MYFLTNRIPTRVLLRVYIFSSSMEKHPGLMKEWKVKKGNYMWQAWKARQDSAESASSNLFPSIYFFTFHFLSGILFDFGPLAFLIEIGVIFSSDI